MFGHGLISVLIYFKKNITIILECFIVFFFARHGLDHDVEKALHVLA